MTDFVAQLRPLIECMLASYFTSTLVSDSETYEALVKWVLG